MINMERKNKIIGRTNSELSTKLPPDFYFKIRDLSVNDQVRIIFNWITNDDFNDDSRVDKIRRVYDGKYDTPLNINNIANMFSGSNYKKRLKSAQNTFSAINNFFTNNNISLEVVSQTERGRIKKTQTTYFFRRLEEQGREDTP